MASIRTSVEGARGCGYRKPGGIYLVSPALAEPCSKLPIELHSCPVCSSGIKPARGWTWIQPDPLLDPGPHGSKRHDRVCPLGTAIDWSEVDDEGRRRRAGLIWIGEKFYSTPREFMAEASSMGVSRRVSKVPREFVLGETWVALAHRVAIAGECEHGVPPETICRACPDEVSSAGWLPGVFTFFRPSAIEYIVTGDESEDELDALEARGFDLVRVIPSGDDDEGGDDDA